jgi:hypothetical protein
LKREGEKVRAHIHLPHLLLKIKIVFHKGMYSYGVFLLFKTNLLKQTHINEYIRLPNLQNVQKTKELFNKFLTVFVKIKTMSALVSY